MLLLGFEPSNVRVALADGLTWPKPEGFDDIYETAWRSDSLTAEGGCVSPRHFLAWAREKEYPIPAELEEAVNRFHPTAVAQTPPATKERDEPVRRKAPDTFVAALIRLIAEISKRAAEKGMPFNVTEMPGTKADFRALAIKFDDKLEKAPRTFDDYLGRLLRFKQGARERTFYQGLFPEFFVSPWPDP
jgi:hypothetical protein